MEESMKTKSSEVTVVISPRYSDKLPTIYESFPTIGSAEIYCGIFNKNNNIYKAEIKEEEK